MIAGALSTIGTGVLWGIGIFIGTMVAGAIFKK